MASVKDAQDKCLPFMQKVDELLVCGAFSAEAVRSALKYKPRPDDIFIVTYPKCGTTWTQNIVAHILREGRPFESAIEFFVQTPFLELTGAEAADKLKRPAAIKLHLPFHLTPYSPEAKYIFVARNPKDCVVSFFHHTRNIPGYKFENGKFDDFFELFMAGEVDFGDYFDTLLSWYEHRNDPNVLFITFEDLKADTEKVIKQIAEFLSPKYKEMLESKPEILQKVVEYSSFQYMNKFFNEKIAEMEQIPLETILNHPDIPTGLKHIISKTKFSTNGQFSLLRKGIAGEWRNTLSEEQNARLNKKFEERTKGTDIPKLWKSHMQ